MPTWPMLNPSPPSLLYPPDGDRTWFARQGLAGTTPSVGQGAKPVAIIELRGWLREVASGCYTDPDWHYTLELDLDWLDDIGLTAEALLRPGDVLKGEPLAGSAQAEVTDRSSGRSKLTPPLLHIELDGWPRGDGVRGTPPKPPSWTFVNDCGNGAVSWPFDPRNPRPGDPPLAVGQYVRVVGSLVTDQPHLGESSFPTFYVLTFGYEAARSALGEQYAAEGEGQAITQFWGGTNAADPRHAARWNEIHSPDYMEVLAPREPTETVRCVALVAQNGSFEGQVERLTAEIRPPARPSRWHVLSLRKRVGEATLASSVQVDEFLPLAGPDRARVRVQVQGQAGFGSFGRFFAVYRVGWRGIAPDLRAASAGPTGGAMLAVDAEGRVMCRSLSAQAPHWPAAWVEVRQGRSRPASPVTLVSRAPGLLDAFMVNAGGSVVTASSSAGVWNGWWSVGTLGFPGGTAVAAVSRSLNKLDLFAADAAGRVLSAAWQPGGTWGGWWPIGNLLTTAGGAASAVVRRPDFLDIFCVGRDGGAYTAAWEPGPSGWRGWWRLGQATFPAGAPITAVSAERDRIDLFAVDLQGRIVTASWRPGPAGWTEWTQLAGGTAPPQTRIAAASRRDRYIDLFSVGQDGVVRTAAMDLAAGTSGGYWPIDGLTARPGTPIEATSPAQDVLVVATCARSGTPMATSWSPASGWQAWAAIA